MLDDDRDDDEVGSFFLKARAEEEQKEILSAMHNAETRTRVTRLLDELTGEQLVTFGIIMRNIATNPEGQAIAQHLTGQIDTLCRVVHKICCLCGCEGHTSEHHELATISKGNAPKSPYDKPLSYHEAVSLVSGPASLLMKYNVYEVPGDGSSPTHLRCKDCDTAFANIAFRVKQGDDCPSCLAAKAP